MSSARNPTPVNGWIEFKPSAFGSVYGRKCLSMLVRQVARGKAGSDAALVSNVRRECVETARRARSRQAADLLFCVNVLCDLVSQGWELRIRNRRLYARAPSSVDAAPLEEKARVRRAHLLERDVQLAQPSVRAFIDHMERRRLWRGEWRSIFSLMRDGRELAQQLAAAAERVGDDRRVALESIIDPYVQPAVAGSKCRFTGLDLLDIWRYFRHTWTTVYQSTPGRKLFFLIRDRAAANHPVIGIGALGSPIIQLAVRDNWIGWTGEQVADAILAKPTKKWATWLLGSLANLVTNINISDFVSEKRIARRDLAQPTQETIAKLRAFATEERRLHQLYPAARQHKEVGRTSSDTQWRRESRTHLFRSKRAAALADLLETRRALQNCGLRVPDKRLLKNAAGTVQGRRAIAAIVRYVKATHAGIDVMDITVCGAIAPYNRVLGGKLVSLLMASPDVIREYARRYRSTPSLIASAMAGRTLCRTPRLVLLGTTSLYGVGASQYHRLRFRTRTHGTGRQAELAFVELGHTVGYGSYHFSQETMSSLEPVLRRLERGRQVNSIFGEGVNPKLRKVRGALDAVGLPSDLLMQHSSPRIVYAIPLAENFREVLLGLADKPSYLLPQTSESTRRLVEHWRERWLLKRIEVPGVLPDVAQHRLCYPITHGARVTGSLLDIEAAANAPVVKHLEELSPASIGEVASFKRLDVACVSPEATAPVLGRSRRNPRVPATMAR
jgi:hypothetical protein